MKASLSLPLVWYADSAYANEPRKRENRLKPNSETLSMSQLTPHVKKIRGLAYRMGAKQGPVTIEDVMTRAAELGLLKDVPDNRMWYTNVFPAKFWQRIGTRPSPRPEAHGRPVTVWAMKTWLEKNPVNGTSYFTSAYTFTTILNEFMTEHPDAKKENLKWIIGIDRLSPMIFPDAPPGNDSLNGIPIETCVGCGAILTFNEKEA